MRRGAITLTMFTLLIGVLLAVRPATGQEPFPTPRGQLGGREPLALTPDLPSPTETATATASPTPERSETLPPLPTASSFATPASNPIATGADEGATSEEAAARVLPAIVAVVASRQAADVGTPTTAPLTVGSGFVADGAGHVVTAAEVVAGAGAVAVVLGDGARREATVVGSDALTGLAVLRIDGQIPAPATLGNASALRSGQAVLAVGVPSGGLPAAVAEGVVGATRRAAPGGLLATSVVQHDAPVPAGAEGGPLITRDGEVVGVNLPPADGNAAMLPGGPGPDRPRIRTEVPSPGVSYAVPAETVRRVLEALIAEGRVRYSYVGAAVRPITPAVAVEGGLAAAVGAEVVEVEADGPGARAGLRTGDIVVSLDGQRIDGGRPLGDSLLPRRPGETVALVVRRGDAEVALTIVLGERPTEEVGRSAS